MKRLKLVLAMLCAFLSAVSCCVYAADFPDVPKSHSNYEAIIYLAKEGVVAGYEDGSFIPEKEITRTEFCALVARTLGYKKETYKAVALPFTDVPEGYWGTDYISFCYERGLINGMGEGLFAPADKVTFEQVIKVAVCTVGRQNEALAIKGQKWYSGYIEVAQNCGLLANTIVYTGKSAPRCAVAQITYNAVLVNMADEESEDEDIEEETEEKSEIELIYEDKDFSDVKVILLDAGHNYEGKDIGARNDELELKEEEITWQIADKLRKRLEKMGYEVVMTREDIDSSIGNTSALDSLNARVELAHESLADLYISIHCNTSDGVGSGAETYCFSKGGYADRLAGLIQENISDETGLYDRGVKTANFYVIKNTLMPAVLVETGFMDNEEDIKILTSKKGQESIAKAIANAVKEYDGMEPIVQKKDVKGSDDIEET